VLFTKEANRNYARNADRLRDMRFARSNEFDRDSAVKARRDSKMSQMAYMNARDPRQLAGLHARVVARGTRAMGAESDGKTYLSVKKQFGIKRPRNAPAAAVRAPAPVVNVNVPNVPQARGAHNPAPPAQAPVAQGLKGRHRGPVAGSTLTTPPRARFSPTGGSSSGGSSSSGSGSSSGSSRSGSGSSGGSKGKSFISAKKQRQRKKAKSTKKLDMNAGPGGQVNTGKGQQGGGKKQRSSARIAGKSGQQ
jgi:uncharacterized membrane protein YgcG